MPQAHCCLTAPSFLAYNPKTGDPSVLRITNAGPYSGDRKLDVSRAAAEKLGSAIKAWRHLSSASCNLRRAPRRATCASAYIEKSGVSVENQCVEQLKG